MSSLKLPHLPIGKDRGEDRATAAILAGGCADGVPSLAVRYWSPHGGSTAPVFITWLLGVGRFCLTVKYGRHSLRGGDWCMDSGSGPRSVASPLELAQLEAMRVSQVLQLRLKRSVPVSPALALLDMERDRRIERTALLSRVPLLWDLERYTAVLAGPESGARFGQPLEKRTALEEIAALMEDSAHAGAVPSRAGGRRFRSAPGP